MSGRGECGCYEGGKREGVYAYGYACVLAVMCASGSVRRGGRALLRPFLELHCVCFAEGLPFRISNLVHPLSLMAAVPASHNTKPLMNLLRQDFRRALARR